MDKQAMGIGGIIILAIALIVGAILLQASAQNVGEMVNTVAVANVSLTTVVNGTAQYLTDYRAISDVVIYNQTGGIVGSGNYTITNNVVYNGALAVKIMPDATAAWKSAWKVSGTGQPLTYDDSSGNRSVASLIVVMMALALIAVAVTYAVREYYM